MWSVFVLALATLLGIANGQLPGGQGLNLSKKVDLDCTGVLCVTCTGGIAL
jgi:hypothetical protein